MARFDLAYEKLSRKSERGDFRCLLVWLRLANETAPDSRERGRRETVTLEEDRREALSQRRQECPREARRALEAATSRAGGWPPHRPYRSRGRRDRSRNTGENVSER